MSGRGTAVGTGVGLGEGDGVGEGEAFWAGAPEAKHRSSRLTASNGARGASVVIGLRAFNDVVVAFHV